MTLQQDYNNYRGFLMQKVIEKNGVFYDFDIFIKNIFGDLETFINQKQTNPEQQTKLQKQLSELNDMIKD